MTIFLDNEPLATNEFGSEMPVGQVIDLAKTKLAGTGAWIVGVRCNLEDVPADRIEQVMQQPACDYERLDLISGRPQGIVLNALKEVREAFADTFSIVKDVAELLAAGNTGEAMNKLSDCIRVWGQAHTSVAQGGSMLSVDFEGLELEGRTAIAWLNDLSAKLRDIKEAIENRDNVLLGDILRYEMEETLDDWGRMIDGFISHVEQINA